MQVINLLRYNHKNNSKGPDIPHFHQLEPKKPKPKPTNQKKPKQKKKPTPISPKKISLVPKQSMENVKFSLQMRAHN